METPTQPLAASRSPYSKIWWGSFVLALVGLSLTVLAGGMVWRAAWGVQVAGTVFTAVVGAGYVLWRSLTHRASLPRLGMDWPLLVGGLAVIGLWIVTPDPRQGMGRVSWLLAYMLMFYLFTDAFDVGLDRSAVVAALLTVSGVVVGLAALETFARYQVWWGQVGWGTQPPFPYRLVSILGHSNAYMAFANLCAPLAAVAFFTSPRRTVRVLTAAWLVMFALTLPFSSSRGGWLGFGAWAAALGLLWGWEKKAFRPLRLMAQRTPWLAGLGGAAGLAGLGAAAWLFYQQFASHPTHGSGVLGSRSTMWLNALKMWFSDVWTGVGPGQFGLAYLKTDASIPPNYWATHAHNLFIQAAAEMGLVGLVAVLGLGAAILRWLWRAYLHCGEMERPWVRATTAAVAGWVVANLVDDFTHWPVVMIPMILMMGLAGASSREMRTRWGLPIATAFIPLGVLIVQLVYGLYGYAPLLRGLDAARQGSWQQAAEYMSQSAKRDPNFPFYSTQAGLAWAAVWGQERADVGPLIEARFYLDRSLDLNDSPSWLWADLAVVDWHIGIRSQAYEAIEQARKIAPLEPSYALIHGVFLERDEVPDLARRAYWEALDRARDWSGHPFWQQTALRKEVIRDWLAANPDLPQPSGYWLEAVEAAEAGDWPTAHLRLLQSEWIGEDALAHWAGRARVAQLEGDEAAFVTAAEKVLTEMTRGNLRTGFFAQTYSNWLYFRHGLDIELVPGYARLNADVGQYTAVEALFDLYQNQGQCGEAIRVWMGLQASKQGFTLDEIPPMPACEGLP